MKINLNVSVLAVFSLILAGLGGCTKGCNNGVTNPTSAPATNTAVTGQSASASPGASVAPNATGQKAPDLEVDTASGLSHATVTITTDKGKIKFKFYSKDAPNTVARFVELIQKGFYNGLTFHRVEDWVIQGGDPTGTGTGGSGQRLKAEFNGRKHKEGTLGMARSADPDSADSQFYIVFATQPHLDGNYTVFGQVTEGMDVAHKIQRGDKMTSVTIE
jgi:cyclophilin family peptidyl-prolyl cis-trans isomerase